MQPNTAVSAMAHAITLTILLLDNIRITATFRRNSPTRWQAFAVTRCGHV